MFVENMENALFCDMKKSEFKFEFFFENPSRGSTSKSYSIFQVEEIQ